MHLPEFKINIPGYGDMTADVAAELTRMQMEQEQADLAQAAARQTFLAAQGTEARTLSFGHQVAQIDDVVFNYWERREGKGFWKDKGNREAFLKKNPSCRVTAKSTKTTVHGITGLARSGGRWAA